jgi:hypothetical protein
MGFAAGTKRALAPAELAPAELTPSDASQFIKTKNKAARENMSKRYRLHRSHMVWVKVLAKSLATSWWNSSGAASGKLLGLIKLTGIE